MTEKEKCLEDLCSIVSNSISVRNGKSSRKLNVFPIKQNIMCLKCGQSQENSYVGKTFLQLTHVCALNFYLPTLLAKKNALLLV